ncbi:hypothetical protein [Hymenobacter volaticus]
MGWSGSLGIAVAPDGTLCVADAGNHAIRCITSAGWSRWQSLN